jgi:hypothetical protein
VISQFEINYTFENVVNEFQGWLKRSDYSKGEKPYKYLDKKEMCSVLYLWLGPIRKRLLMIIGFH